MAQVFRFPDAPSPLPPKSERRATFFTVVGGTGRAMVCASYEIETGLELRLSYRDNADVMRSELFRGTDREMLASEAADLWRALLLEKGFTEVEG
jgi:hypothetical protein